MVGLSLAEKGLNAIKVKIRKQPTKADEHT